MSSEIRVPYDSKIKMSKCDCTWASEINSSNIRLRMTLKINVGMIVFSVGNVIGGNIRIANDAKINYRVCVFSVGTWLDINIRLRMTLNIKHVGWLSLASEIEWWVYIRLRMTLQMIIGAKPVFSVGIECQ